jgi:peptidoglycan/LPS O-acetylase OafA/YrhL
VNRVLPVTTSLLDPQPARGERLLDLDAMRIFAASFVLLYHYGFRGVRSGWVNVSFPVFEPAAKYGFLGVYLFFMISGFVILRSVGHGRLDRFLRSRILRLYPAFWVCATLTFVLTHILDGGRFAASPVRYLVNLTMGAQFVGVSSIDGAYWSLYVEWKFYALIAAVLITRQMQRIEALMAGWLLLSVVVESGGPSPLRSLLITPYAPFFVAGCVYCFIFSQGMTNVRLAMLIASGVAQAMVLGNVTNGLAQELGVPISAVVAVSAVAVFHLGFVLICIRRSSTLRSEHWKALGALTYPLYLVHQVVGYSLINDLSPHIGRFGALTSAVLLSFGIAWVVSRYTEPFVATLLRRALSNFPVPLRGRPFSS